MATEVAAQRERSTKKVWFVAGGIVCALALVAGLLVVLLGSTDDRFARLRPLAPRVEVSVAGEGDYALGTTDQELAVGDTVRTDREGRCEIAYHEGSLTRLGPDAIFELTELTDAPALHLRLEVGRLWQRVARLTGTDGSFRLHTPAATATVAGTVFAADCSPEGACTFTVTEGALHLTTTTGEELTLRVGEQVTIAPGGAPGETRTLTEDELWADEWFAYNFQRDGETPPPTAVPTPDADSPSQEETTRAAPSFDLRLGQLTTLTGDLSAFGRSTAEAGRIAVEVINETLERMDLDDRISVSVQLEDTQTDADAGVEVADKLVSVDDVQVIVGALASRTTRAVVESVAVPNGVVQISPASTDPTLSVVGDDGYSWRTAPSDALQGAAMADAMRINVGGTVNTGARDGDYGSALQQAFEEEWRAGGGAVGRSVTWDPDGGDFDAAAQQLASGEPAAWFAVDFPETWASMGPALVRTGRWDAARTFTTDGLRSSTLPEDAGRDATEGMRGLRPFLDGDPDDDAFDALFSERSETGVERRTFDAPTFDAVMVSFLAAVAGRSADPPDIRANLEAVSGPGGAGVTFQDLERAIEVLLEGGDIDYQGASGPIDFDNGGDPRAAFFELWSFRDGEIRTSGGLEPPSDAFLYRSDG